MSTRSEFRFGLAGPDDEPELRALVGSLVMPGAVSVRFEREPDYFLGTTIQGDPCDVLIARHEPDGALAGVMVRGERLLYLNGVPERIAYLGQIRIAPRFQGRWLMQRAVLEMAQLRDAALPCFGVIATDNPIARGTIAGRRPPGAPRVERVAHLRSLAFVLHDRGRRARALLPVQRCSDAGLDELVAFLQRYGPSRQLFPVIGREQLADGQRYRGLHLGDLHIVRRDGAIAGVLASWDQSSYKQEIVAGYAPRLRLLRPGYDLLAAIMGGDRLPRNGEPVRTAFGSLRCVADDDPDVLEALLCAARAHARRQGLAFLMVGFDDRDPQLRTLRRSLHVTYESDVFLGSFGAADPGAMLDDRPVCIEIGTL
ncbi:MAG TPA: hypothetical protein VK987_11090 [Anaerolineae bacterium]|jgi:hypothetical protein|nr:hypothetical protein [Anaerolineae bacterium]